MKAKIVEISDQSSIKATDQPEIFKFSVHTPGNFETYLSEIEDFDPKQDQIYLPKDAKRQGLEVWLKDIHPFAYEIPPFEGEYKKVTSAILSISSAKHSKNKNHPQFEEVYKWSVENYPELTKHYYNEEYIDAIFVAYWNPGIFTVPNDSLHRAQYQTKYSGLLEQFGGRTDFEIYFHEDSLKQNIALIQRHPSAMRWEKYKLNNPDEFNEYQEKLSNIFAPKYMPEAYAEQIESESNLALIKAKDATTGELVRSIYYHDGTPAWKTTKEPETKDNILITRPQIFNKRSADKITNFNPSTDNLDIYTDSFGIASSATFAAGKNKKTVKKKLAKQDFDFLYDEKKGGLYFNENGVERGFGDGGIIAILKGAPELTRNHLIFS